MNNYKLKPDEKLPVHFIVVILVEKLHFHLPRLHRIAYKYCLFCHAYARLLRILIIHSTVPSGS